MKVWLDGKLVDKQDAKLSVFDHGTLYGDGVFEGIRVYSGRIFQTRAHMDRLCQSADAIRLKIPYSKKALVDATYETLRANNRQDAYVRMVVTRGEGGLGLNPNKCPRASAYIIVDSIELFPRELYETGMPVIIAKTVRTSASMLSPKIKSLNYLNNIMAKMECNDAGVSEALMLNEKGNVCEGSGDNLFVVKSGTLITPPESAGILMGVTRAVVMKLAGQLGIPLAEKDLTPQEVCSADECFLTGSAAEIIAVNRIDGKAVGAGVAGPITRKLTVAFHEFIRTPEASE